MKGPIGAQDGDVSATGRDVWRYGRQPRPESDRVSGVSRTHPWRTARDGGPAGYAAIVIVLSKGDHMSRRPVRSRLVLAAIMLAVVGGLTLAALALNGPSVSGYSAGLGCEDGPVRPGATEEKLGKAFLWPYGDVHSCRPLGREGHWFGDVDVSAYVLLDTDRGLVAMRVDFRRMDGGRQYTADAYELAPDAAPGILSAAEKRRLRDDQAARGGPLAGPWTLHYGDG